jgi:RNA polymerase sigma-70 factor (sigma-E family)
VTYEEFVHSRLQSLLRYAVMLTGDPHTAQDLVQETMIRVQVKWRRVVKADQPERYVQRMLTNAYIDLRRGSWLRRVTLFADPAEPRDRDVDHAEHNAARDEMWVRLAKLPRRQRAALVLRFYEGLPDSEIAEVLGCAVGTVRAHISRALATLRAQLAPGERSHLPPGQRAHGAPGYRGVAPGQRPAGPAQQAMFVSRDVTQ